MKKTPRTRDALVVRRDLDQLLERAEAQLTHVHTIDDAKRLRDQVEAFQTLAKRARLRLADQNHVALLKILVERRGGEALATIEREQVKRDGDSQLAATLAASQIAERTGRRWQMFATIPESEIRQRAREATASGEELTSTGIEVEVRKQRRAEMNATVRHHTPPSLHAARFRVIYADPPWQYNDERVSPRGGGKAADHYPTMAIEEIAALTIDGTPVREYAADNAVLFLWVTAPKHFECAPVIAAWGFTYKTSMVWNKDAHNYGHYVSVRHEYLLIATRGSCVPDRVTPMINSVQTIPRSGTHSAKPPAFRDLICRLYNGPYLELFARDADPRFVSWGNQVTASEPIEVAQ